METNWKRKFHYTSAVAPSQLLCCLQQQESTQFSCIPYEGVLYELFVRFQKHILPQLKQTSNVEPNSSDIFATLVSHFCNVQYEAKSLWKNCEQLSFKF